MKNNRVFLSENFQFLRVKFSIYLNRHVFVMDDSRISLHFRDRRRRLWRRSNKRYAGSVSRSMICMVGQCYGLGQIVGITSPTW